MSSNRFLGANTPGDIAEDDRLRSTFMAQLFEAQLAGTTSTDRAPVPRTINQYWDNSEMIPDDVRACIATWSVLEGHGWTRRIFDDSSAADYIASNFNGQHLSAFERCVHPAMRADYFRLCLIANEGGVYVDADDEYRGVPAAFEFAGSRLRVRAFCYDIPSDTMVDPKQALSEDRDSRVFYVNNNPLIAPANHPIVELSLQRATNALLTASPDTRDVQALVGPGNLTAAVVHYLSGNPPATNEIEILFDWDECAPSRWPLEYRLDTRNWRLWVREPRGTES